VAETWHTLEGRLRWAIEQQPPRGRERGLRLFQRRMDEHGADVPGTSLSAIQGYLRGDGEPSPTFLKLAAQLLAVRSAWLAFGEGAPTEEAEAGRRESAEEELFLISTAMYEALGVPTKLPKGSPAHTDKERFWGSALWGPTVRQTALRLFQFRPGWALLSGEEGLDDSQEESEVRFWRAVADTSQAIAAPLHALGIDPARMELGDVREYVEPVALALQRAMYRYVPDQTQEGEEDNDEA